MLARAVLPTRRLLLQRSALSLHSRAPALLAPRGLGAVRPCSSGGAEKKAEEKNAEEKKEEEPKASESSSSSSSEEPLPLHQRFLADIGSLFDYVKGAASGASAAASNAASSATSSGAAGGAAGEAPPSADSGELVVRPPSFWERFSQTESPFFERLRGAMGGVGDAADRVGDFFGETEQAEALGMLREQDPYWRQEAFLTHIHEDLGPEIIGAYLKGDLDVLRANCRDQAYAILSSSVHERQTRQLRMDPRVLFMSEPELESVRIINGQPTIIVSFETHQLYCIRSALTNKVEEGDEDDIRAFHYLWALQLNEESDAKEKWQITELAIRGVLQTY